MHKCGDGSIELDSVRFARILRDKMWDLGGSLRENTPVTVEDFDLSLEIYAIPAAELAPVLGQGAIAARIRTLSYWRSTGHAFTAFTMAGRAS